MDMPTTELKPSDSSDVELALLRLTALLSQQEKILEHPWSNADIYLYDFRAQQISDLIAELEDEKYAEATQDFDCRREGSRTELEFIIGREQRQRVPDRPSRTGLVRCCFCLGRSIQCVCADLGIPCIAAILSESEA